MSAPKFTPGPWFVLHGEYTGGFVVRSSLDPNYSLAQVRGQGGANEANARLIAAAPELYKEHEKDVPQLERIDQLLSNMGCPKNHEARVLISDILSYKRAALAKAGGR